MCVCFVLYLSIVSHPRDCTYTISYIQHSYYYCINICTWYFSNALNRVGFVIQWKMNDNGWQRLTVYRRRRSGVGRAVSEKGRCVYIAMAVYKRIQNPQCKQNQRHSFLFYFPLSFRLPHSLSLLMLHIWYLDIESEY